MTRSVVHASRVFQRTLPDGRVVVGTALLDHIEGNASAHFSLTGEEWATTAGLARYRSGNSERALLSCGQLHDLLVETFPELEQFAKMHLADEDGVPMYAVENGWYWYSGYDGRDEPSPETAAELLRVAPDELPAGMSKDEFVAFVDAQRSRWRDEAIAALAFLKETS